MPAHDEISRKEERLDNDVNAIYGLLSEITATQAVHTARLDLVDERLGGLDTKVEIVDAKVQAVDTKVEIVETKVDEVLEIVRTIKSA